MARVARSDVEAAYFTLLRARDKLDALRRYGEFLEHERLRLQRFVAEGDALDAHVDPKLRRALLHTDRLLGDVLKVRHETITDELARLGDRIEAAETFVRECEEEHEALRRAG
ncbi:MAG: hypothetical protein KY469_07875 [Actinobacteria bacterium]|nr:hypothetical protein [Actinomycetota bacterium]